MARFSIEDTLFELSSFKAMEQKLGNATALGAWVGAGRLAQLYWKQQKLIPKSEIKFVEFHLDLVEHGFLEEREDGYYFRGAKENFQWLVERVQAAAKGGQASAKRDRDEHGRLLPKESPSKRQANAKQTQPESSPLTPSLTLKEVKNKNLPTVRGESDLAPAFEINNPVGYFISKYREAFRKRYSTDPDVRGKVQGQIKQLLKDYPANKAVTMIQVYLQMSGKRDWFVTKGHDFGTFMENLNPIAIALAQGVESGSNTINWDSFWQKQGDAHAAS